MKLYFVKAEGLWQTERYRYAAEQMLLSLFPGERPEYPAERPKPQEADHAVFSLTGAGDSARLTAQVNYGGKMAQGEAEFPFAALENTPEKVYPVVQHALKMAFYQAGVEILGHEPPWGALTGVRPVKLPTRSMKNGASPEEAQRELEEKYRVSPVRSELAVDCAKASLAVERSLKPDEISLYIGIPFCPGRCAYCSFVSSDVGRTLHLVEPYLDALCQELDATARTLKQAGLVIRSFYVGGGTPTTLSAPQLHRLLTHCEQVLPLERCTEYTVEAGRPDTITREKLEVLSQHHIGRISINPQTLEDKVLAAVARKHAAQDIYKANELARSVGFSCVNMDLIAGLPLDSAEGFCRSLEGVLSMEPENVTVHTLALKKGAALMENRGSLPQGDEVARMLEFSLKTLRNRSYAPYYLYRQKYMSGALENVGWTKPGLESLYNIVMMEELHSVISVGGGGVTKLVDAEKGRILRLPNPKYPHEYLSSFEKVLTQKAAILDFYAR